MNSWNLLLFQFWIQIQNSSKCHEISVEKVARRMLLRREQWERLFTVWRLWNRVDKRGMHCTSTLHIAQAGDALHDTVGECILRGHSVKLVDGGTNYPTTWCESFALVVWEQCRGWDACCAPNPFGFRCRASRVYILRWRKHINAVMHPPPPNSSPLCLLFQLPCLLLLEQQREDLYIILAR